MSDMTKNPRLARTGYIAFALSGICAISNGIIVSLLQEKYGLSFALTGTLLSLFSVGNMLASFIAGVLPGKIGMRNSIGILVSGYFIGYTLMAFFGNAGILMAAFLMAGLAKGTFKSLAVMGISCSVLYVGLVVAQQPLVASLMLFGFAFAMAGVNPVGVAGVGKMMNETSMGVLLPAAGCGAILMPWLIGFVADHVGLQAAMCVNLVPCLGIFVLSMIIRRMI